MEIKEAIEGRRSVREYEPEAIDESVIHRLIAAAVKAPSAVNQQPWTFTVVRDQELLERISRKAKELPQHAQGKIRPWNSGAMGSGRTDHCREAQSVAAIGSS